MRIGVGETDVEVRAGVPVADIVAFARRHGEDLPDRPWCGVARLSPEHRAGDAPLTSFARLTRVQGPDARPRPGAHLAVVGGPDAGLVATLAEGLVAGRGAPSGLRLSDPTVGDQHACFGMGRVRDLGSPNGTTVAGKRVRRRTAVRAGDVIRLGGTTLVICAPGEDAARAQAGTAHSASSTTGLAAGGAAGLSMAAFAIMTGHWPLALVAAAIPAAGLVLRWLRRSRPAPAAPLLDVTGTLNLAPLPAGTIAVSGPRGLARAVALTAGAPPRSASHWEPWMSQLPAAQHEVRWLGPGDEPPSWAQVHVRAEGAAVSVTAAGATAVGPLPLVSEAAAEASARRIAALHHASDLPATVRWAELPPAHEGGLPVRLGMGLAGPVVLDLVANGPHLLVAGTTGSGKSEALRTIIGSLAHDFSPRHVTFALIDFKGGASLAPCAGLPHVGCLLTDLEPHLARRCLLALGAELADRKRAAATASATSFDDWHTGRPPRLVVVIDEFQEIAAADRDFLPELARLAAQGRSLGIHLVLATQRPAGAVGAAIRANIGATLALRTASESESRDLLGTEAAAGISAATPGRAVLARGGTFDEVQVALPRADLPPAVHLADIPLPRGRDLCDATVAHAGPPAAPLWQPPLPQLIALPSAAPGFTFGVVDDPRARRRAPLRWDPGAGPLVVTGSPGSGRSSTLGAIEVLAQRLGMRPVRLPADARLAVRTLVLAADIPDAVLLVDDTQRTLSAASAADPEAADLLAAAMLRLPTALVVPPSWSAHRLTATAGLRLVHTGLGHQDEAAWGMPQDLRGLTQVPGRVRVGSADGWREAHVAWHGGAARAARPLVTPLPAALGARLSPDALGIGTDEATVVRAPPGRAVVVGPPGAEREAIARRVAVATGTGPVVCDNAFSIGGPGQPTPRTILCVRPTARSVREVTRTPQRGLIDPSPPPLRTVAVIDGVAMALQVLPA